MSPFFFWKSGGSRQAPTSPTARTQTAAAGAGTSPSQGRTEHSPRRRRNSKNGTEPPSPSRRRKSGNTPKDQAVTTSPSLPLTPSEGGDEALVAATKTTLDPQNLTRKLPSSGSRATAPKKRLQQRRFREDEEQRILAMPDMTTNRPKLPPPVERMTRQRSAEAQKHSNRSTADNNNKVPPSPLSARKQSSPHRRGGLKKRRRASEIMAQETGPAQQNKKPKLHNNQNKFDPLRHCVVCMALHQGRDVPARADHHLDCPNVVLQDNAPKTRHRGRHIKDNDNDRAIAQAAATVEALPPKKRKSSHYGMAAHPNATTKPKDTRVEPQDAAISKQKKKQKQQVAKSSSNDDDENMDDGAEHNNNETIGRRRRSSSRGQKTAKEPAVSKETKEPSDKVSRGKKASKKSKEKEPPAASAVEFSAASENQMDDEPRKETPKPPQVQETGEPTQEDSTLLDELANNTYHTAISERIKKAPRKVLSEKPWLRDDYYNRADFDSKTKLLDFQDARVKPISVVIHQLKAGTRVALWWQDDYFTATILKVEHKRSRPFRIRYLDGEEEWLDLADYKFFVGTAEETPSDIEGQEDEDDDQAAEHNMETVFSFDSEDSGLVDGVEVGSQISVWWKLDRCYYSAQVKKIEPQRRKPYFVCYSDGESEWVDLQKTKFLMGDGGGSGRGSSKKAKGTGKAGAKRARPNHSNNNSAAENNAEDSDDGSTQQHSEVTTIDPSRVRVGTVLEVKWNGNKTFYDATVIKIDKARQKSYKIKYRCDGVVEWIRLTNDNVRLVEPTAESSEESEPSNGDDESDNNDQSEDDSQLEGATGGFITKSITDLPKSSWFLQYTSRMGDSKEEDPDLKDEEKVEVGTRLKIDRDDDGVSHKATVLEIDFERAKSYLLEYADRDCGWIDLRRHDFTIVPVKRNPKRKKDAQSTEPQTQKAGYKSKSAPKHHGKTGLSKADKVPEGFDERWEYFYDELVDYHAKHGHSNVKPTEDPDGRFFNWIKNQRYFLGVKIQEGKLSGIYADRVDRLDRLDFNWHAAAGEYRRKAMAEGKSGKKPVNLRKRTEKPATNKDDGGLQLKGGYAATNQEKWDAFYDELVEYHAEHGHCNVKPSENQKLHTWIQNQKYSLGLKLQAGTLSGTMEKRVARLNKLGLQYYCQNKSEEESEDEEDDSDGENSVDDVTNIIMGSRLSFYFEEEGRYESTTVVNIDPKRVDGRIYQLEFDDGSLEWRDVQIFDFAILDDVSQESIDALELGCCMRVWWPGERKYFKASLEKVDKRRPTPHFLVYDDGDEEWTNLRHRKFELLEEHS